MRLGFATLVGNALGKARRVYADGREWIVAPAVSIVGDSVLPGSQGPLFYPSTECARNVQAWNGRPVTAYHPMAEDGSPVAATYPGVAQRQYIGVIRDTIFNGNLRHQVWIDVEKARAVDPYTHGAGTKILRSLERGVPVELSTGLYTTNLPRGGYSEKSQHGYTAIATAYVPDHLAILPDQKGACSLSAGCGLLVNTNPQNRQGTHNVAGPKDGCGDGG